MHLSTALGKVLSTKQEYLDVLESMGMKTVEDLLLYFPRGYEDLSDVRTLFDAPINQKVTLQGTIDNLKLVRTRTKKQFVKGVFIDTEGASAEVIWFNQTHILRMLKNGDEVILTGKLVEKGYKLQLQSPVFESAGRDIPLHSGRIVPVYPQHEIINSKWLREKINLVIDASNEFVESLPASVIKEQKLIPKTEAIRILHMPKDGEELEAAKSRMAFEEMFNIQKQALERKQEWQGETQERLKMPMNVELIKAFFASLKFSPTGSQKIAIYEILKDMEKGKAMSRLLEGDVGSGKTLVATAVLANVIMNGGQCAFMVPTEVLARQHSESIAKMLIGFKKFLETSKEFNIDMHIPRVSYLTGSVPKTQAEEIKTKLATGNIDLIIGTHALIEEGVQFKDLRFVIVDEQHRFGVNQRQRLKDKGNPHFLSMTATPIPRTLALTGYGHHDLSVLLEKPGNRKPIETKVVSPNDRKTVEGFINHQIDEGRQVFVVCPLIKESENEDFAEIKNVTSEAARLKEGFLSRNIALLHGKMPPAEKEEVMRAFKDKKSDILVSTSVIEVGIDVPNASIIIIEGSERFGLAQLHQFRGRVGRGDHKSYCFLFTTTTQQAKSPRLKAMEKHDSGFTLAEIDLKIRGPGEMYGFRQSGMPDLHFASLLNPELVVRARQAAEEVLNV